MTTFTRSNRYNKYGSLSVKTWNIGGTQGDICDNFWRNFCSHWINSKISPYDRENFDGFVKKNINSFLNYTNFVYNIKEIKKLNKKYSVETIGRYFRKYYTIVEKILKDYIENINTIYFLQEINYPVIIILEHLLKKIKLNNNKNIVLDLLDMGSPTTTAIMYSRDLYSLENKNVFDMNNYFGKTFITLMNVIWEQHSENTNENEKDKVMASLKDKYAWIWKEFRYANSNKSNENNILSILLKSKKTNKKLLCLNIHNPCWWIDEKHKSSELHENMMCFEEDELNKSIQTQISDINPRNYFDENILYIIRNISIHNAIDFLTYNITNKNELGVILAGDFNIDGNIDYDVSKHLDGDIFSSNIKNLTDRLDRLNFNTNRLFDTKFDLINCHKKYYPSNNRDPGKVKVIVKDKETRQKVEKEINFFTQKSFNSEKILDRVYISRNLKMKENMNKIIEKQFCSDHVILSVYLE